MQIVVNQREWHGMSFNFNYTFSKNIGDDGTVRFAFAVPAAALSTGIPIAGNNRADRDIVATDTPITSASTGLTTCPTPRPVAGMRAKEYSNLVEIFLSYATPGSGRDSERLFDARNSKN